MENTIDIFETKKYKPLKAKSKKTKAAGLKSLFYIEDELLMTSFGKGNKAIIEKETNNWVLKDINKDKPNFNSEVDENRKNNFIIEGKYKLEGKTAVGSVTAPKEKRKDIIGCKDVLEKRYFGQTFDDNIHIQLIYNILDIEKILTVHINDIVYALDNLQRIDGFEKDDFIGYMSLKNTYDVFCNPGIKYANNQKTYDNIKRNYECFEKYTKNPRLRYFDCITYKGKNVDAKQLYYMLAILGEIRQFCAHSKDIDAIYNLEKELCDEAKKVLDELYEKKVSSVNSGFIKNNERNMVILFQLLGIRDYSKKVELAKQYYDFAIKKGFKNIGFSIKKLREQIVTLYDNEINEETFDSIRSKLYTLFDFIVWNHYSKNPGKIENNLNSLRACGSEDEKDDFYKNEAGSLWNEINGEITGLKEEMLAILDGSEHVGIGVDAILETAVTEVGIKKNTNYFCKIIYLMTLFMDGKEINDLITTLINKFENIASFIDVMNKRNIPYNFKGNGKVNFIMFEKSKKIAGDLRAINSFARMSGTSLKAKRILYVEAAKLLGVDLKGEALVEYIQDTQLGDHIPKKKHDFRNFIASNVIESSRFKYLVKYANPEKVRAVANNKDVIKFVLAKIPSEQIDRYYESCTGLNDGEISEKIEKLADIIGNMNFKNFEKVKMDVKNDKEAEKDKMQKQAIISLYLTVLYLLVKNLVNVNARYFLAFHCLERDKRLYGIKTDNDQWLDVTKKVITDKREELENWYNNLENPTRNQKNRKFNQERNLGYLQKNMSNIDETTITLYRNNVDHLNPIRNIDMFIEGAKKYSSYFELYHYLMQRSIEESAKQFNQEITHSTVKKYIEEVKAFGGYSKDFVKALNIPFGYNLARFKNLSIDALFDMHNPPVADEENKK